MTAITPTLPLVGFKCDRFNSILEDVMKETGSTNRLRVNDIDFYDGEFYGFTRWPLGISQYS